MVTDRSWYEELGILSYNSYSQKRPRIYSDEVPMADGWDIHWIKMRGRTERAVRWDRKTWDRLYASIPFLGIIND